MADHNFTPPQWQMDAWQARIETMGADVPAILLEAAQWGADQELEACCEWLEHAVLLRHQHDVISSLRAARRPKPPSLKERLSKAIVEGNEREALKFLEELDDSL